MGFLELLWQISQSNAITIIGTELGGYAVLVKPWNLKTTPDSPDTNLSPLKLTSSWFIFRQSMTRNGKNVSTKDEADAKMLVFSQPVLLSVCNTGRIWQMISRVNDMSLSFPLLHLRVALDSRRKTTMCCKRFERSLAWRVRQATAARC